MTFDHRRITGPDCLGRRARWSSVCVLQHAHWPTTEGHSTDLCVHASRDRADRDSTSLGQICKPASSLKQMAPPTSRLRERKSRVRCQFGLQLLRFVIAELMDHMIRYDTRQLKNVAYSDKSRLNVMVKFAPFATKTRRVLNKVRSATNWCAFRIKSDRQHRRTQKTDRLHHLFTKRFCPKVHWSSS